LKENFYIISILYRTKMSTDAEPQAADDRAAFFECNVCLDVAKEPVVSLVSIFYERETF